MASTYVLGNESLQYTASTVSSRFRLYFAAFNPIQITVQSQDIQTDQYGQYINAQNVDLLANHVAPYAPQPNFGPNRIGFVNEPLFFDGARSTQRGNLPPSTYQWSVHADTPTYVINNHQWVVQDPRITMQGYNHPYGGEGSQCNVTFSYPGLYTIALTVSDRFGSTTTGTRQIMIYQNREATPRGIISLDNITGDIGSGGWSGSMILARSETNIVLPDALPIGWFQPVAFLAETEYEIAPGLWQRLNIGPYAAPIPGQYYDDPRILFSGYIQQGSADQTVDLDTVSFQLIGSQLLLQQAEIHNIGYYNTTYNQRNAVGTPISLNPSSLALGQLVADLTSEDMYRSLLLDHSNFGLYHDIIIWRDMLTSTKALIPWQGSSSYAWEAAPGTPGSVYYLTYSTLTANEGTIWDACSTMAQNEFADMWCDQRGAFCIGPTINMRGYETMQQPTSYGPVYLGEVLNYTSELGSNNVAASWAAYLNFLFGSNRLPQPQESATGLTRYLGGLIGPPILCHFSDVPVFDTDIAAPNDQNIFNWVAANWPQDLSIRPIHSNVTENYTTRTEFVKLVATLVTGTTVWSSWYPLDTFDSTGLMKNAVAAGQWDVETSLLLPDALINGDATARARSWQYLWEIARRKRNVLNAIYTAQIDGGMWPWIELHDLFAYTRQRAVTGPKFSAMLYYTQSVTHSIDMTQNTWKTSITGNQVTSQAITPMITPPFGPPANNS